MVKKILVVDDEAMIREILAEWLEMSGYECCTASDGHEGLVQVREQRPDLVITDIRMPRMDGYEFSRRVRQISDVPIIVITGQPLKDVPGENLMDGFIEKPVQMADFLAKVGLVLAAGNNRTSTAMTS